MSLFPSSRGIVLQPLRSKLRPARQVGRQTRCAGLRLSIRMRYATAAKPPACATGRTLAPARVPCPSRLFLRRAGLHALSFQTSSGTGEPMGCSGKILLRPAAPYGFAAPIGLLLWLTARDGSTELGLQEGFTFLGLQNGILRRARCADSGALPGQLQSWSA